MDDQFEILQSLSCWHELLTFYKENQPDPADFVIELPDFEAQIEQLDTDALVEEASEPEAKSSEKPQKQWAARAIEIEGLSQEELSKLHGQLIALGYLEFDLISRSNGIGYLISSTGKKALANLPCPQPASSEQTSTKIEPDAREMETADMDAEATDAEVAEIEAIPEADTTIADAA